MRMQPWESLLRTPAPCDHIVQLYSDEAFFARAVALFLQSGFVAGEGAVVIATPAHVASVKAALGKAVLARLGRGQLTFVDAQHCLSRFMVDGTPDREKFFTVVNAVLDEAIAGGYAKLRLFGEMVDLLWDHNLPATVQLEELWNELLAARGMPLLCAYRIDNFDRHAHRGVLHQISRCHSHLVPVEDYERFERAVDRAYREVFGARGDAALLRQLLGQSRDDRQPGMPAAQSALLALRDIRRDLADEVLERARTHYRRTA
jgi:hypothetical protein